MKKIFLLFIISALALSFTACGGEVAPAPVPTSTPTARPTASPTPTATPSPTPTATPEPTPTPVPPAVELTAEVELSDSVGGPMSLLRDGNCTSRREFTAGQSIYVTGETPIAGIYLCFYKPCPSYTVTTANGETVIGGEHDFLHEYIALPSPTDTVTVTFSGYSVPTELRVFSEGALPGDVQCWEVPDTEADVLIFSTHADDDVIFFGAAAALCVEQGLQVQVCYLVNHYDWQPRPQELLDALWAMGVHRYPIIGPFSDLYSMDLESAIADFGGEERVIQYEVELLRRFRPSVAFAHDFEGEYGHGAHMLYAETVAKAVSFAADATYDPGTAEWYGTWQLPKLYIHFYENNALMLDAETPLSHFGGRTAFEVATDAMQKHVSQLVYLHRPTLESEEFPRYDCRRFGLYLSTVGPDTGNDFMEHIDARKTPTE